MSSASCRMCRSSFASALSKPVATLSCHVLLSPGNSPNCCPRSHKPACHDRPLNKGWLLLIVPGLIWGASFLFIAEGLRAVGPNGITFLRIAVGFATLAFFPAARKPIPREDWGHIVWLGVL